MKQAEAEALYGLLRDGLRRRMRPEDAAVDFPDAIEQEIAAGKQVRVHLSVASEQRVDDPLAGGRITSSRSRVEFVQQRDFASTEKVAIMLDGIALARVAPAQMADEIFGQIRKLSPHVDLTLCFAHEQSDEAVRKISAHDVTAALPATQTLALAIEKIRAELGSDAALFTDIL